ncbi:MAG: RND family transporter [bacterium]
MLKKLVHISVEYPKTVIFFTLIATFLFGLQFPKVKIDTDPENMLSKKEPDRVFYSQLKRDFGIRDMIVLGITDEKGIFNSQTLDKLSRITTEILKVKGVIIKDVISFTTTDNVKFRGGLLEVNRIMEGVPKSPEEINDLKKDIFDNPLFLEKIVSLDSKGVAIYIPIEEKNMSYRISKDIEAIVEKELDNKQKYYIAGLPVAEDTFGHEMFKQMGITAPLTGMVIFLLLFLLFRKFSLIISSMIVAMFSVAWGMGLLIGLGFTVHIMSSMIPIFLMPIAVLDSVHILSEFYDRYPSLKDRKKTILAAMDELFSPMLYTSLTSAIGFGSLALAPIPPVRVFGIFVAFGIMAAWLLTITFIPATIMLIREEKLEKSLTKEREKKSWIGGILPAVGNFTFTRSKTVVLAGVLMLALGIWGVSKVVVNDNPVKWFKKSHKIRIADTAMNRLFGGTYMASLVLEGEKENEIKRPEVIGYIDKLQRFLEEKETVGKTSSVADIIKRINYVLHGEDKNYEVVPKSLEEIAQYLFLFLNSSDPDALDNFVDYNFQKANIWVQLKSGDNKSMERVVLDVKEFTQQNPLPGGIKFQWSGLTYINKIWQDLMVSGMLKAILGSFVVVFFLMVFLFRSPGLGFIAMLPLTFAILLSYGIVGLIGKDYDMPIAICSSLSLGLAIDFAIHFIQRFRERYKLSDDIGETNRYIFSGPGRAILRNAIVIIFGFLPLAVSTLTPYITVGVFFASLMIFSTIATLVLLPALMKMLGNKLLKGGVR